ncbi:MAG: hypothetical protein ACREJC_01120, partial [Tepidisphaeraceae bacterium]
MRITKTLRPIACFLLTSAISGCDLRDFVVEASTANQLVADPVAVTIGVGESAEVMVAAADGGRPGLLDFRSANPSIATVDRKLGTEDVAVIVGVAPGSTIVEAKAPIPTRQGTAIVSVTVLERSLTLAISPASQSIQLGQSAAFT